MHLSTLLNMLFTCLVNAIFMIAGIVFNSVVIISLWRSSQLRKKLCYFMILVLSCFDMAVVVIIHPLIISSTIIFSLGEYYELLVQLISFVCMVVQGFSMFALLSLNIERFLGVTYPIFHRTSVTKKRLLSFLAFAMFSTIILSVLSFKELVIQDNILVTICMSTLLTSFVFLNIKMLNIAKSKRRTNATLVSTSTSKKKRNFLDLKKASTASLTVLCLVLCSSPEILLSALCFTWKMSLYDKRVLLFSHWIITFMATNSTFNCLIFFWRNSILRREGNKIVKTVFRQSDQVYDIL